MQKIMKIGVLPLAKIFGLLYAVIGLISGVIVALVSMFGGTSSQANLGTYGTSSIFILPIIYGITGFIGGLLIAYLYNLIAKHIGGIELEIK